MDPTLPGTRLPDVTLRPLERSDLHFVHVLNNNRSVMGYWFEEPYESFVELEELYRKHIHDQSERRFIVEHASPETQAHERVGLVELVEIDHLHRRAEFLIMISPDFQQRGFAKAATRRAINYAFRVLNLGQPAGTELVHPDPVAPAASAQEWPMWLDVEGIRPLAGGREVDADGAAGAANG